MIKKENGVMESTVSTLKSTPSLSREISNDYNPSLSESRNKINKEVKCDIYHNSAEFFNFWTTVGGIATTIATVSGVLESEKPKKLGEDKEITSKDALALRTKMLERKPQIKEKSAELGR